MRPLLDRCQAALLLAADLLRVVKLPGAQLLPLLRAAMTSLAVEGQKLLQARQRAFGCWDGGMPHLCRLGLRAI